MVGSIALYINIITSEYYHFRVKKSAVIIQNLIVLEKASKFLHIVHNNLLQFLGNKVI